MLEACREMNRLTPTRTATHSNPSIEEIFQCWDSGSWEIYTFSRPRSQKIAVRCQSCKRTSRRLERPPGARRTHLDWLNMPGKVGASVAIGRGCTQSTSLSRALSLRFTPTACCLLGLHAHTHMLTHAHTHANTHAYTHAYTLMHTHAHTPPWRHPH